MPGALPDAQQMEDAKWMHAALALAERSVGLASPNPMVGCVIVRDGELVGEGWHEYDRKHHAEVVALAAAAERASNATAYVTLEPCSHQGRTGPCVDALLGAGVARVVGATVDPNPLVSGRGFEKLRAAGVEVTTSFLEEQARQLNDAFACYIRTGLPLVTLKAALSLDGRIAPSLARRVVAAPFWLTSLESRQQVQLMRHASDALLTGINTVFDDDPLLTDRTGLPRRRPLLRVVLDSGLRLRLDSKLVQSAKDDVLVFCTEADDDRRRALEALGIRVELIEAERTHGTESEGKRRVSLPHALERLGELRMTSVMIEAGTHVNTSAMQQGLVDRLFLLYAPLFLGSEGVPLLLGDANGWPGSESDPKISNVELHRFGLDIGIEALLRDPWLESAVAPEPVG